MKQKGSQGVVRVSINSKYVAHLMTQQTVYESIAYSHRFSCFHLYDMPVNCVMDRRMMQCDITLEQEHRPYPRALGWPVAGSP